MIRADLGNSIPVGVRFQPTDEELLDHYLKLKTLGSSFDVRAIPVVNICDLEPWELPARFRNHFNITSPNLSGIHRNDHQWYFFCPRDGSSRVNRSTNNGYWKPTGEDRQIKSRRTGDLIGSKKTLVFYKGRARNNSLKTNWVIHEYQLNHEKAFVLNVLKENWDCNVRGEAGTSSVNVTDLSRINESPLTNHVASGAQNQVAEESPIIEAPESHPEPGLSAIELDDDGNWKRFFAEDEFPCLLQVKSTLKESNPGDYAMGESSLHSIMAITIDNPDTDVLQSRNDPIMHASLQADEPFAINCIDRVSPEFPVNNTSSSRTQYRPRSSNAVAEMSDFPRLSVEGKGRETATEVPEKESSNVMPKNELGMAGGGNAKLSLKELSGRNKKGSINFVETPISSSHGSSPPHFSDFKDSESSSEQIDPILESLQSLNINSHGEISQGHSSNSGHYRRENIGVLRVVSGGSSASSVDSIADKPKFPSNNTRLYNPVAPRVGSQNVRMQEVLCKEACQEKVKESNCITEKQEGRPDSVKERTTATKLPQIDTVDSDDDDDFDNDDDGDEEEEVVAIGESNDDDDEEEEEEEEVATVESDDDDEEVDDDDDDNYYEDDYYNDDCDYNEDDEDCDY